MQFLSHFKFFLIFSFLSLFVAGCEADQPAQPSQAADGTTEAISTKVSETEAKADLEGLLADLDNPFSRGELFQPRSIKESYALKVESPTSRAGQEDSITAYVFNFEDDRGFAVMSGDTRIPSLIAITEDGNLPEGEEVCHPGMEMFLAGMQQNIIDRIKQEELQPVTPVLPGDSYGHIGYTDWQNTVYYPNGLCKVMWGQDKPYNSFCPFIGGKQAPTGCVATAVAQLMSIYKFPPAYKGYVFSWDEMTKIPDAYYGSSRAQQDVGSLMCFLGLKENLEVTYGSEESGAKGENVPQTLRAFGYSNGGKLDDYNIDPVIPELQKGFPVLIQGYSHRILQKVLGIKIRTSYAHGHMWLAHGVLERGRDKVHYNASGRVVKREHQSEWYILCNWGWGSGYAAKNGYYLSKAFHAAYGPSYPVGEQSSRSSLGSDQSNVYQYNIKAITDIRR